MELRTESIEINISDVQTPKVITYRESAYGTAKNKEAALLAHELNIKPNHILTHNRPQKPIDFTIVIGSDFLNKRF
jgi:hypothetical protein